MSNVKIKRLIENIKANTTVYTPIVEVIVNAIQAIDNNHTSDGKIIIRACRSDQLETDGSLPDINSFEVEDNGIGFTDENRDYFDTLYTDHKIAEGGKGFGRFTCLKYFEDLSVDSIYQEKNTFKHRKFSMGKDNDIIVCEKIEKSTEEKSRTIIFLKSLKKGKFIEKNLSTVAKNLVEKLLPYFISAPYTCPEITLSEKDGSEVIKLNDYFKNELSDSIKEIAIENNKFKIKGRQDEEEFLVRLFKFYSPKNQKSKISLVAHKREVSSSLIHNYIPEFIDEFYEKTENGHSERNYIIKVYVFSEYLNRNVSVERGGFEFQIENDLHYGISQTDIETEASLIAKEAISSEVIVRQEKKKNYVQSYVDEEAPWYKSLLSKIDLTKMTYNPSNEEIESYLHKEKFKQETQIKAEVKKILHEGSLENLKDNVLSVVSKISESSKNELVHYIALRRNILDLFSKSLELDETGTYSSEGTVHDIIFPRRSDTEITSFEDHNLWVIDERLNFTYYVSSDLPLNGNNSERPDLAVYDKRVFFRGDNEPSNPITIFEFKKPQRDDFANPSSREDPVQQIVRYVNDIRDGKYKTPEGREVLVTDNTPFYGYVVCDLTHKVKSWLHREKNFKPMPDGLGWFHWMDSINLYVEVISWDKVLKDAKIRNQIFFQKLGISD